MKKCAYDLFLCGVAGSEIILACSMAQFMCIAAPEFYEALGCATVASISGVVLLAYSVENLVKHSRELKQQMRNKKDEKSNQK